MKKISIIGILVLFIFLISGCEEDNLYHLEMSVKDYGIVKMDLDKSVAPITVKNFVKLVKGGFYDGKTFHRVMKDFMIQGGSPTNDSNGGLKDRIKGEFMLNGVENSLSHKRGVVSMARSNDYNSASCQFFIVQKDSEDLDGKYAAFGWVTEGMDIIDEIANNTKVEDGNGTVLIENQPVIEYIKIVK